MKGLLLDLLCIVAAVVDGALTTPVLGQPPYARQGVR